MIVRIAGLGRIGTRVEMAFDFDVRSDLTGRLTVSDYGEGRADGSAPTLRVDPTDAGTAVTAFRMASSACSDPSRGAEFDGTGREDTGALVGFTVVACDNGPPENGLDFFDIALPSAGFSRSGSVTSGDIARSTASSSGDTLVVSTSTSGSNLDVDGYTVTVDRTNAQLSATNGRVTFTGLAAGDHPVALSGVAANCTVSGANPQTVTVPAGGTASATFAVSCTSAVPRVTGLGQIGVGSPTPGTNVQTFEFDVRADLTGRFTATDYNDVQSDGKAASLTTDASTDPATSFTAYRNSSSACSDRSRGVEFDAVGRERTGAIVSYTVVVCDNGPAGSGMDLWSIFLPSESYDRSGNLTSGDIAKSTAPSSEGSLAVSTGTTGSNPDPDGYMVTVDGTNSQPIPVNGSVTFTGLSPSSHTVVLSGVAANCTVSGGNSQTVTVPFGGTATAAFAVSCAAITGDLTVTTSTSGSSVPSGYTVTVDETTRQAIGINSSVTFANLAAGTHTVELSGVASNCTVSGGTSRMVTVPSGGTATVSYSVGCITPNQPPTVNAGPDETSLIGLFYAESASFSDPDNNGPWSYTITWGDGSSTTGSTSSQGTISASHTYLLFGSYTIRVTVTDSAGASGSDTKVVTFIL